jgi:hypothetical protein
MGSCNGRNDEGYNGGLRLRAEAKTGDMLGDMMRNNTSGRGCSAMIGGHDEGLWRRRIMGNYGGFDGG